MLQRVQTQKMQVPKYQKHTNFNQLREKSQILFVTAPKSKHVRVKHSVTKHTYIY